MYKILCIKADARNKIIHFIFISAKFIIMNDFLNSYANSNNLILLKIKQNCTMMTDYIQSIISRIYCVCCFM